METYNVIDMECFERTDYFQYFMSVGTTIEFTVKMDVTKAVETCKRESINFQSYVLFKLYKVMNAIKNFKYDMVNGTLIEWHRIVPTFSSFNQRTKMFFTLYADMKENYLDYDIQYSKTVETYKNSTTIVPQGDLPPNVFNVSCIPWLHFEHFSSNSKLQENQIIKMITLGRYKKTNEGFICPFTVQVSHAIVDGYHVSLLFEMLQEELNII